MATFSLQDSAGIGAPGYVEFTELYNNPRSPKYVLERDRSSCLRVVDVGWDDVVPFARAVLGYPLTSAATYSGIRYVSRRIPWAAPIYRSGTYSFLYASKIEFEGLGPPLDEVCNNGENDDQYESRYEKARCTVHFDTRTYDIVDDATLRSDSSGDEAALTRYVTKIVRPAGEFLTLDSGAWYYAGSGNASATPATAAQVVKSRSTNKIVPSWNLSLTWHEIPKDLVPCRFLNPSATNHAIDECLGRVNHDTFANCLIGTLLLMAVELKPIISPFGDRLFDITYMFKYFHPTTEMDTCDNPVGHNHVFWAKSATNSTVNKWYEILTDKTLAETAPMNCTNFIAQNLNTNIYDFAPSTNGKEGFKDLFRPA